MLMTTGLHYRYLLEMWTISTLKYLCKTNRKGFCEISSKQISVNLLFAQIELYSYVLTDSLSLVFKLRNVCWFLKDLDKYNGKTCDLKKLQTFLKNHFFWVCNILSSPPPQKKTKSKTFGREFTVLTFMSKDHVIFWRFYFQPVPRWVTSLDDKNPSEIIYAVSHLSEKMFC